jgi:hypothetical protein
MPNAVTGASVRRVSFVKRGAIRDPDNPSEPHRRLLWKAEDHKPGANVPKGAPMTLEETQAALAKAEKERDEALAKAEGLEKASKEKDDGEPQGESEKDAGTPSGGKDGKFEKSELPEPVRAALEKAEENEAAALKKAEEAEKIAKEERDLRLTREFIAKAEDEFRHVGNADKLGPRLMKMEAALSKEDYEAHLQELRSLNEQIATSKLFKEAGVGGRPADVKGDSAAATIAKAEELRKSDPNLSEFDAFRRAAQDPAVQKAYLAERG